MLHSMVSLIKWTGESHEAGERTLHLRDQEVSPLEGELPRYALQRIFRQIHLE